MAIHDAICKSQQASEMRIVGTSSTFHGTAQAHLSTGEWHLQKWLLSFPSLKSGQSPSFRLLVFRVLTNGELGKYDVPQGAWFMVGIVRKFKISIL